jgi:hypothetical protein
MEIYGAHLTSLVIGVIGGVIAFYVTKAIDRYWARRTLKSLKRRLEYAEARKARLDDLAKFDRAIILLAFRSLFALIGFAAPPWPPLPCPFLVRKF